MENQYDNTVFNRLTSIEKEKIRSAADNKQEQIFDINLNDVNWQKQLSEKHINYTYEDSLLKPATIVNNLFNITNEKRVPTNPGSNSIYVKTEPSVKDWNEVFLKCQKIGNNISLEDYVKYQEAVLKEQILLILERIHLINNIDSNSAKIATTNIMKSSIKTISPNGKLAHLIDLPSEIRGPTQINAISKLRIRSYERYIELLSIK